MSGTHRDRLARSRRAIGGAHGVATRHCPPLPPRCMGAGERDGRRREAGTQGRKEKEGEREGRREQVRREGSERKRGRREQESDGAREGARKGRGRDGGEKES